MYSAERIKKEPSKRITPRAIRAWQWSAAAGNLVYFIVPVGYWSAFGADSSSGIAILLILAAAVLILWILGITLLPYLRWKKWRYSIDENEIDLKRGILIVRRTLIPLRRVQHVDTRQGPVLRYYNLATVTISTAATTHEIPALDAETADKVRDVISKYARLAEEDV
ncbi:MAG: PH domain-containing protein [Balneolaceae bacterium]